MAAPVQPFVPHMTLQAASQLKVGDDIDFRLSTGQFCLAKVTQINSSNVQVNVNDYISWCDYNAELYRFAAPNSISKRPRHRTNNALDLKVGGLVDINPKTRHPGWKTAEIESFDLQSGQIQVLYHHGDTNYIHWLHIDDETELAPLMTKVGMEPANGDVVLSPDDELLEAVRQASLDQSNNVDPDDMNVQLQKVVQQSMQTDLYAIQIEGNARPMPVFQSNNNNNNNNNNVVWRPPLQPGGLGAVQGSQRNARHVGSVPNEAAALRELVKSMEQEKKVQDDEIERLKRKVSQLEHEKKECELKLNELQEENKRLKLDNLKPENYKNWSVEEVVQWIVSIEPGLYDSYKDSLTKLLTEENFIGEYLAIVDVDTIKRWGITDFRRITILHRSIQSLVERARNANNSTNQGSDGVAYI